MYGGLIRKSGSNSEKLSNSIYGQSGYWPLNFNDIPSGMGTMFCLLHVNNMHVTAAGIQSVSPPGSRAFFVVWYAIGVLLLLNVLTAFFLNEFTLFLAIRKKVYLDNSAEENADFLRTISLASAAYSQQANAALASAHASVENAALDRLSRSVSVARRASAEPESYSLKPIESPRK